LERICSDLRQDEEAVREMKHLAATT
jgi:hypothetical protein